MQIRLLIAEDERSRERSLTTVSSQLSGWARDVTCSNSDAVTLRLPAQEILTK